MPELDFASLIAPMSLETFLEEHWELRPLHLQGGLREGAAHAAVAELADRMLAGRALRKCNLRAYLGGREVAFRRLSLDSRIPRPITEQVADPSKVFHYLEQGATVIAQGTQDLDYDVACLVRAFEGALPSSGLVDANLFITARAVPGLPEHYDNEDLFVLQVEGEKTWHLSPALLALPLPEQTFDRRRELATAVDAPTPIVMRPGDLLYVPRGYMHRVNSGDRGSIHLTIGLAVHTVRDALLRAMDQQALEQPSLREAVPLSLLTADDPEALLSELRARLCSLNPDAYLPSALDSLLSEALFEQRPLMRGQLEELEALERVSTATEVRRRRESCFRVTQGEESVRLQVGSTTVTLAAHTAASLGALLSGDALLIGEGSGAGVVIPVDGGFSAYSGV